MPRPAAQTGSTSTYQTRADLLKQVSKLQKKLDAQAMPPNVIKGGKQSKITSSPSPSQDEDETDDLEPIGDPQPFNFPGVVRRGKGANLAGLPAMPQIVIHPTAFVRNQFTRRRRGLGGFQSLHSSLAGRMQGTSEPLILSPADFARIVHYATHYGDGGFQQSLRWLVALWVAENLPATIQAAGMTAANVNALGV